MSDKKQKEPTPSWGYRLDENGEVESKIFDGDLPKGWVDSPAKLKVKK